MNTTTKTGMSYSDLTHLPEDNKRHELIDGEHIMTPSPNIPHQRATGNLYIRLYTFVSENRLGEIFIAPLDVVFSPYDVVEPDILFISNERVGILTLNNVQGAPDLVVEVISPNTESIDRQAKFQLYERCGVSEYWIVDPSERVVDVYGLAAGSRYETIGRFAGAEMIQSRALSGFSCRAEEVFGQEIE